MITMISAIPLLSVLLLVLPCFAQEQTCTWNDASCYQDPNLKEITIDLGKGKNETFLAYHPPDVSTFYQEEPGSRKPVNPIFSGQIWKFINLSPFAVRIYWDAGRGQQDVYLAETAPFQSTATATRPGHRFLIKSKQEASKVLLALTITKNTILYKYDPIEKGEAQLEDLTPDELEQYNLQKDNLKFAEQYKAATGNEYLSLYPRRHPPINPMWPADYFGQEHSFLTRETHFVELPPAEDLEKLIPSAQHEPVLKKYRKDEDSTNMTMKVLSCSPRVFEIKNFLSKVEIDHIMQLATGMTLHESSTKAGNDGETRQSSDTRTSRNSWVTRGKSPIIDAIYRRSADLLHIDEAFMRNRVEGEMPHVKGLQSNSEQLQLVHYKYGQQYTPHHDFAIPKSMELQPMRYVTILFYLNHGMLGGETAFPRWLNAETSGELEVVPEVGKAIMFYSLLPDGNMDERSQHAANPVSGGEKWLINSWTWDPYFQPY